jgi:DNA-binding IclR family transcriptional regulator
MGRTKEQDKASKPKYDAPAARMVVRLLEALCNSREPLGVTDLVQRLGASPNMVFRLLQTLEQEHWVVRMTDDPKYAVSLIPFHHLSKPVARMDVVTAAHEPMRELWKQTGESVYLGVLHGDKVLYLIHHEGTRNIHLGGRVGECYWLHAAAAGKVLAAYGDPALRERCVANGLAKLTKATHTDRKAFFDDMARVLKQGFALDDEEYMDGGLCYAAPVFDYTGGVTAAVGTTVLTVHYRKQDLIGRLGPVIQETARRISAALGWRI